jgi:hypothetical protein
MGYKKATLRRMRPRQRELAKAQTDLESVLKRVKKLVAVMGEIEGDWGSAYQAAKMPAATLNGKDTILEFDRVALPPCPDEHTCWKCGRMVSTSQADSLEEWGREMTGREAVASSARAPATVDEVTA